MTPILSVGSGHWGRRYRKLIFYQSDRLLTFIAVVLATVRLFVFIHTSALRDQLDFAVITIFLA